MVAVYIPALGAGFIWDDPVLVTENPLMWLPGGLRDIWTGTHTPDYIPLTLTAFWLEWRLWGRDPAGYHLVNLRLHAANGLLFWRILVRLGLPAAWLAALLFAVHPMNAASVAWIAEGKNTLSLLLMLVSTAFWLRTMPLPRQATEGSERAQRNPRWKPVVCYGLSVLAGIAAMLSKGSAVVLPALLFVLCWAVRSGSTLNSTANEALPPTGWKPWVTLRQTALRLLPFALAAAVMTWVTIHFQSRALLSGAPEPFPLRLARAPAIIGFYYWKTLCPVNLAPVYPPWTYEPLLGWLSMALLLFAYKSTRSSIRPFVLHHSSFILSLLPVLGVVARPAFFDQAPVADWWNYVPMLGICGLAGAVCEMGVVRLKSRRLPYALAAGAVLTLGVLTWKQAEIYADLETYSRATLARNPAAWMAHTNLGLALADRGALDAAIEQYTLALRGNPRCFEAHTNLASALAVKGRLGEAEGHLREVLASRPRDAKALNNLGSVLFQSGRADEAIATCKASLKVFPYNAEALNNLGLALAAKREYPAAIEQYRAALQLDPGNAGAWFNAGNAFAAQDRREQAAGAFAKATRCAPAMASASNRLARELIGLSRPAEAEAEILRLFRASPRRTTDPALLETLAVARAARRP